MSLPFDITPKDYIHIVECILRNFTREQIAELDLLHQDLTLDLLVALGAVDFHFFELFFLREHFEDDPAPMHRDLGAQIRELLHEPGNTHDCVMWPRGFAKSTHCSLALPIYVACYKLRKYIILISHSQAQSRLNLLNIKTELATNERLIATFGALRGRIWSADEIITKDDIRLDSVGAGSQIRGRRYRWQRPDLVLIDDIEHPEEVRSPTQVENLKTYVWQDVMLAGDPTTKFFVIGNLLGYECVLSDIMKNPLFRVSKYQAFAGRREGIQEIFKRWTDWEQIVLDITNPDREVDARKYYEANKEWLTEGLVSNWPARFPVYKLMHSRATGGHATFATEMMNDPLDPSKTTFHGWAEYHTVYEPIPGDPTRVDVILVPNNGRQGARLSECVVVAATDPSLGKTRDSDYSAIVVIAKDSNGLMYVLDSFIERVSPNDLLKRQDDLYVKWGVTCQGMETVAFQELLKNDAQVFSAGTGSYQNIVAIPARGDKTKRIQAVEPDMTNGYIMLPEDGCDLLKEQIRAHGTGGHDDGPDALEMARHLAKAMQVTPSETQADVDVRNWSQIADAVQEEILNPPVLSHNLGALDAAVVQAQKSYRKAMEQGAQREADMQQAFLAQAARQRAELEAEAAEDARINAMFYHGMR